MNRKYLYAIAALIWGIPGIIITSNIFPAFRPPLPLRFIPVWARCFFCPPEDFCLTQGESYLCRKDTFYERGMSHL